MNKNPLFIHSTIKQTYVIPVIKHCLSLYPTHTSHESHDRISMEEQIFLLDTRVGRKSDTSPGKAPCLPHPHHHLLHEMPAGSAGRCWHFQFSFPTSTVPHGSKPRWQRCSAWDAHGAKQLSYKFPSRVPPICVRFLLAG